MEYPSRMGAGALPQQLDIAGSLMLYDASQNAVSQIVINRP